MIKHISIKQRLLLATIAPLIILALLLVILVATSLQPLQQEQLKLVETSLDSRYKQELKNIVETAYQVVKPIYESGGERQEAVELLSRITFGGDGYIFGYDSQSVRIFSGNSPASIGKSYADFKDVNGVFLINDLVKAGKRNGIVKGDNFVTYHFPRLGEKKAEPKLSYSIFLDRWDLMIGTGVYIDRIETELAIVEESMSDSTNGLMISIVVISLIVLAILFFISLLIIKSITHPLDSVTQSIKALSEGNGDLTQRLEVQDKFELGTLSGSLNELLESLQLVINRIKQVAVGVNADGEQVARTASEVDGVISNQVQEVEQVASAATQMSESANMVAYNAQTASKVSIKAEKDGRSALETVKQSSSEMEVLKNEMVRAGEVVTSVGEDVNNISSVLQVIESIAEQTNLLALNAAIEAARAGEQGRGFAVVADEVRTLASKTQGSTEEIQAMIAKLQNSSQSAVDVMQESVKKTTDVEQGVRATANSLEEITDTISTLAENNAGIVGAAEEQRTVGEDINKRIIEISEQSNEMSQFAGSNAQSADSLKAKTTELENIISTFRS